MLLPREQSATGRSARRLDVVSLVLLAIALAALEIALKEAPQRGWLSRLVLGLMAGTDRCRHQLRPADARRRPARRRPQAVRRPQLRASAALLSFVLGIGLFGSVYLMPVFLAFVRGHGALEIGQIMLVTGVAQLLTAPVAVALERRLDARVLTAFGFTLFAVGLGLSACQTRDSDFAEMFWPQVLRGVAIMFCLLPPTRLALGGIPPERVPDASGAVQPDAQSRRRHRPGR